MKVVLTMVVGDDADVVGAQIAYHLNAGVDFVIATDHESRDGTTDVLESYARAGFLKRISESGAARESEWRTRMATLAAAEHGADWLIDSDPDEFWWPRAETLKDVLAAIPLRYTIVQALVRQFVSRPTDRGFFADELTIRSSLQTGSRSSASPAGALRPIYRAHPRLAFGPGERNVPLRAWYPVEVFRFPGARHPSPDLDEEEVARCLRDGDLVADTRLAEALRTLRGAAPSGGEAGRFALPVEGAGRLTFRPPDIVDDAAYAVECAAVGEVNIDRLEQQISELQGRIEWLEARFWPRVLRTASRLVRRSPE